MAGSKSRPLLKIASLILLLFGIVAVVELILTLIKAGLGVFTGALSIGIVSLIGMLVADLGAIIQVVAGCFGLFTKKYTACRFLSYILIILGIAAMIMSGFKLEWIGVLNILIPIVYLLGTYV